MHAGTTSDAAPNQPPDPSAATADLPPGLPAEWVFDADLPCPACRYNLRMLRTPRCPECGVTFRWQALLRIGCPRCGESLAAHDGSQCPRCELELNWPALLGAADVNLRANYFEYSDRPIRATLRSFWSALRPARFWRTVPLESPPAVRRLRRVRNVILGLLLVVVSLPNLAGVTTRVAWFRELSYYVRVGSNRQVEPLLNILSLTAALFAILAALPLTALVGLPYFAPTLARFQIRRDQLLRCLTVGLAGAMWSGLFVVLVALVALLVNEAIRFSGPGGMYGNAMWLDPAWLTAFDVAYALQWGQVAEIAAWLLNAFAAGVVIYLALLWQPWNLWICLTRYLRLDRANAAALRLSVEVIGLLIILVVVTVTLPTSPALQVLLRWSGLGY